MRAEAAEVAKVCAQAARLGEAMSSVHALVSREFFDRLISHPKTEEAYKFYAATGAQPLREDMRRSFPFGGIVFEEYSGTVTLSTRVTERLVPASEGIALGTRLGNSIRLATYSKASASLNAAARVWSNAPVIIGAHDAGPLIRSKDGFWLAIPTAAAGKSTRGGRITPGEWERRTGLRLRFVYRRRGPSLLVAEGRLNTKGRAVASRSKTGRGMSTVPIFPLVPQVKLQKRLDLTGAAKQAVDSVPGRIVANW